MMAPSDSSILPYSFPNSLIDLFGERGRVWVERLPQTLAELAERWELTLLPPFPNLSYNYAAPALRRDGAPVVLKMSLPGELLVQEHAALERYAGRGAVRLLAADPAVAVLMVERLEPGTPLSYLVGPDGAKDDETTLIAAEVMPQLWRPLEPGHPFQTVEYLAKGLGRLRQTFNGGAGPFPAHLVTAAEALYAELMPSQGPRVLLHGDLHHENILLGQHGWLAIDPQGFAGEAEYEVGALLRNPTPQVATWPDLPRRMARRLDLLSERLGFDRQRLWGWALAQAVLSLWWDYEDHGHNGAELPGGKIGLPIAEALYAIR